MRQRVVTGRRRARPRMQRREIIHPVPGVRNGQRRRGFSATRRSPSMFKLPDLPYEYDALEPTVSSDTLHFHHDKHHKAYVDKTNELAEKAGLAGKPLEDVVREASAKGDKKLFNNAAQAWNHAFFWQCMAPGGKSCTGQLKAALEKTFGSVDQFKDAFVEEGVNHFASGWVWLVTGSDGLKVISTH